MHTKGKTMEIGAWSDKGRIRENNEDSFFAEKDRSIFIVADGVGGQNAGEVASGIAVSEISGYFNQNRDMLKKGSRYVFECVEKGMLLANEKILERSEEKEEFSKMATTAVIVVIRGSCAYISNVGDSRAYEFVQDEYDCIYSVVDLHSITVRQDPATLRRQIRESAALLLACGVDPEKAILFIQGDVHQHAELSWILGCYTQFGELSRMTQFKDKSQKHPENVNGGLFTYPVLMAADILLYQTDLVPIGADQKQHLELARNIAERFNGIYGQTFVVPDGYFPKVAARVMSLQDPTAKMSKSDENVNAKIMLLDDPDLIIKKFRRAVTDSESVIRASEDKPGVTNLMSIYSACTGKPFEEIEREFEGKGYGDFKTAVGETVRDMLKPIQEKYALYLSDKDQLNAILKEGAEKASSLAARTLAKARRKIGLD